MLVEAAKNVQAECEEDLLSCTDADTMFGAPPRPKRVTYIVGAVCVCATMSLVGAIHYGVSTSETASILSLAEDYAVIAATIPLEVRETLGGFRITLEVQASKSGGGYTQPQRVILDSGSATLSFCDPGFAKDLPNQHKDGDGGVIWCNTYGCNPGGCMSGFWGYMYQGDIVVGSKITLPNAKYANMEVERNMPCSEADGIQGIFGVGLWGGNKARKVDQVPSWPKDAEKPGACPTPIAEYTEVNILQNALRASNMKGGDDVWGVALSPAVNGRFSEGQLYLGADATTNAHAKRDPVGTAALLYGRDAYMHMYVQVLEISVGSQKQTNLVNHYAMIDTGDPAIWLPPSIFASACHEPYKLIPGVPLQVCKVAASEVLTVKLRGTDGDVTLELDLAKLNEPEFEAATPKATQNFFADGETRLQSGLGGKLSSTEYVFGLPLSPIITRCSRCPRRLSQQRL